MSSSALASYRLLRCLVGRAEMARGGELIFFDQHAELVGVSPTGHRTAPLSMSYEALDGFRVVRLQRLMRITALWCSVEPWATAHGLCVGVAEPNTPPMMKMELELEAEAIEHFLSVVAPVVALNRRARSTSRVSISGLLQLADVAPLDAAADEERSRSMSVSDAQPSSTTAPSHITEAAAWCPQPSEVACTAAGSQHLQSEVPHGAAPTAAACVVGSTLSDQLVSLGKLGEEPPLLLRRRRASSNAAAAYDESTVVATCATAARPRCRGAMTVASASSHPTVVRGVPSPMPVHQHVPPPSTTSSVLVGDVLLRGNLLPSQTMVAQSRLKARRRRARPTSTDVINLAEVMTTPTHMAPPVAASGDANGATPQKRLQIAATYMAELRQIRNAAAVAVPPARRRAKRIPVARPSIPTTTADKSTRTPKLVAKRCAATQRPFPLLLVPDEEPMSPPPTKRQRQSSAECGVAVSVPCGAATGTLRDGMPRIESHQRAPSEEEAAAVGVVGHGDGDAAAAFVEHPQKVEDVGRLTSNAPPTKSHDVDEMLHDGCEAYSSLSPTYSRPCFTRSSHRKERMRTAMRYMNFISRAVTVLRDNEAELRGFLLHMLHESDGDDDEL